MSGRLEQIWIKRAHRGVMDPVEAAALVEGKGVQESANFGSYRQVTLIALERWLDMMAELGADLDPSARRADLLVSGVDLESSRGRLLDIGECVLRIGGEMRPCDRMEEAVPGQRRLMGYRWSGGVWAEVVRGGAVRVNDPVAWQPRLFEESAGTP